MLMRTKKGSKMCQKWDSNPRLHSETRTLNPVDHGKEIILESGALDRSAILTLVESARRQYLIT